MKMRVRGSHLGGAIWGGKLMGGAHITVNTEWKIFILHRNVLRGIL